MKHQNISFRVYDNQANCLNSDCLDSEIIGNIHENPELLEIVK